tara:strand:+ start:55 stop:528 length:474 start_codon:yes stop_codon:yes gene_type:complete
MKKKPLKEFLPEITWEGDEWLEKNLEVHDEPFEGNEFFDYVTSTRYVRDYVDEETGERNYYAHILVTDAETDMFTIKIAPTFIPEQPDIIEGGDKFGEFLDRMGFDVTIHTCGNKWMTFGRGDMMHIAQACEDAEYNLCELYRKNWTENYELDKHKD